MEYFKSNKIESIFDESLNLDSIANNLETDKGTADARKLSWGPYYLGHHCMHYTPIYQKYMNPFRLENVSLFEVGICDQRFPFASCKMWATYFKNAKLYALDNFWNRGFDRADSNILSLSRLGVDFFYADQGNTQDWDAIEAIIPKNSLDFFVEDGSHFPEHMIYTLWRSINLIKSGGYYFMEDIGTNKSSNLYGYNNTEIGASLFSMKNGSSLESSFLEKNKLQDIENNFKILEITEDPMGLNYLAVLQKL